MEEQAQVVEQVENTKPTDPEVVKENGENKKDIKQEKKYTDEEVNAIISKKFKKLQKQKEAEIEEAKKLADMNAQQKAEHERDKYKQELESLRQKETLNEMSKEARKMLSEKQINISDDLLSKLVSTDADETKNNVDSFILLFNEAVDQVVKEKLKSPTPKVGVSTPKTKLTKEEIIRVKDDDERKRLIRENAELFNIGGK